MKVIAGMFGCHRRLLTRLFIYFTIAVFIMLLIQTKFGSEVNTSELEDIIDVDNRLKGPLSYNDSRVIQILRQRYLTSPSQLPYNLSTDTLYKKFRYYWTWGFIYSKTKMLFDKTNGGFFIEAGALDGERLSNTLWLEQELGWTGLLIEPSPYNYNQLVNKRRKAWISETCLSTHPYPEEQIIVTLSRKHKTSELEAEKMKHNFHGSSHLLGITIDSNIYDHLLNMSEKTYSVVQCFPLMSYLIALNITTVDLLSLDIQGAEKGVLKNIPWDSLNIRVIVVEIVFHETMDGQFVNYIETKGYQLIYFRVEDYVFVKKGDPLIKQVNATEVYINAFRITL